VRPDDEGVYEVELTATNLSQNHFINFEIMVQEHLYSNEDSSVGNNENNFSAIIGLSSFDAVLSVLSIILFWKYFKKRNSLKQNGEASHSVLLILKFIFCWYRPDGASDKTPASGERGMEFKSRTDQISYTLPTTRHHYNLDCVGPGAKPQRWSPLIRDTLKGIKRV